MSVTRPGVQKLNMLNVSSPKAAIAANLGSASRSTGVSYGIFAQRSLTGSGIHLNNRAFNSASISATRHALNDNRTALFNNIGVAPHRCNNNNGNNTMNKFMAGMMAMNMMAQLTAKTVQTINEAKAGDVDKTTKKTTSVTKNMTTGSPSDTPEVQKSLNERLNGAATFAEINGVENDLSTKLNGFGAEYGKIGKSENGNSLIQDTLSAENVKAGLQSAGVEIDYSKLTLSNITLTDASSIADITKNVGQIDADKKAVEDFQNTQIKPAIESCKNRIDAISTEIRGIDSSISRLEAQKTGDATADKSIDQQITELKEKKEQLEAEKAKVETAKETLETTVKQQINDITTALEAKKDELNDLKKTKSELMDKKYDLAKDQDEKITKNKTKMDKLNKEIATLRNQTTDPKKGADKLEKLNAKIGEYNDLVAEMKTLYASLKEADATEFTNSKNQKYTVKNGNEDSNYTTVITPVPIKGAGNDTELTGDIANDNAVILEAIDNCQNGQVIDLGNATYTKGADGNFTSDLGQIFTANQLKQIHTQNEMSPMNKLFKAS